MTADRHTIAGSGLPTDTTKWLHRHGYKGAVIGTAPGTDSGMLFARAGEPPRVAWVGDTLVLLPDGTVGVESA